MRCWGSISNCDISDNCATGPVGGGLSLCGTTSNCTISGNSAGKFGGGVNNFDNSPTVRNCILWGDTPEEIYVLFGGLPTVTYSDIEGGFLGTGNIDAEPCFSDTGSSDPNEWDYHLQSVVGRWGPKCEKWVVDANTSPCIDAGDPNSDWTGELWPHGKQINMGAYGGTPEASMSLSSAGNIADLDNSGFVDYIDIMAFMDRWLYEDVLLSVDLDRNGIVNFIDFAIFSDEWLWEE